MRPVEGCRECSAIKDQALHFNLQGVCPVHGPVSISTTLDVIDWHKILALVLRHFNSYPRNDVLGVAIPYGKIKEYCEEMAGQTVVCEEKTDSLWVYMKKDANGIP